MCNILIVKEKEKNCDDISNKMTVPPIAATQTAVRGRRRRRTTTTTTATTTKTKERVCVCSSLQL
jgi:hypothetical protein